jgi:hypothetical protein
MAYMLLLSDNIKKILITTKTLIDLMLIKWLT